VVGLLEKVQDLVIVYRKYYDNYFSEKKLIFGKRSKTTMSMLPYHNQATQVMLVDISNLVHVLHHPGMSKVASCLRDVMSLAILSTSSLVPSFSLIISWPDHVQMVLPITPVNTSTAKAVTAAILKLDQALNRMDVLEDNMDKTSLPAAFSRVLELVGQNEKDVQLHVLTCRPLLQLENLMAEVIKLEGWPAGLRIMKVLSPAVVLDREEEQSYMHVQRFTFTDWLDLDSYFREWLVHQSSDQSDLKVEMSHRGVRVALGKLVFSLSNDFL
jgi:hypothetical protein